MIDLIVRQYVRMSANKFCNQFSVSNEEEIATNNGVYLSNFRLNHINWIIIITYALSITFKCIVSI